MKSHAVAFTSFIDTCTSAPEYSGVPILEDVIDTAFNFMYLLPDKTVMPEIDFENDGDIYFEWYVSKARHFSAIVSSDFISYSLGAPGGYSNCKFAKDTLVLPDDLLAVVKDFYEV